MTLHEDPERAALLAQLYREASGDDFASTLTRASRTAHERSHNPDFHPPESALMLYLNPPGDEHGWVDPYYVGEVLQSIQSATARMYRSIRKGTSAVPRITAADRRLVDSQVDYALAGSLSIRLVPAYHFGADITIDDSLALDLQAGTTPLDLAARELVDVIDEKFQPDQVITAVRSARPVVRRAVKDLVQTGAAEQLDLRLTSVKADGTKKHGRLEPPLSKILNLILQEKDEEEPVRLVVEARFDGYHGRHREFYLYLSENKEISGVVDDDEVMRVVETAGRSMVRATLLVTTFQPRGGGRATRAYRLIAMEPIQGDPSLFEADASDS